jgi:hypothetical protein
MLLRLVRFGSFALATAISGSAFFEATTPASAQGGIVCEYGPASYRRCCKQSYARNPSMGARARADDIDACMGKGSSDKTGGKKSKAKSKPKDDDDDD